VAGDRNVPSGVLYRLGELLAGGGIVAWEVDPTTLRFIGATPLMDSVFGGPHQVAEGWLWGDHVHPDDRDAATKSLIRALTEGGDHELEYRAAGDGPDVWIRDVIRIDRNEQGRRRVAGVMVDVSRLRRAEADLQAKEYLYRQLVEMASDILFRTDVTGHFTFVNRPAVALFGYQERELLAMHYLELILPAHHEHVRGSLERQFRDRIPNTHLEFAAAAKDGTVIWIEQNTQLIVEQSRVTGFQAIARDVTERRGAQEALAESERRYRLLAENALDLIGLYTPSGRLLYASPSHERVLRRRADELEGATLFDLVDERDATAARAAVRAVVERGQPVRLEVRMPTRGGGTVLLDALISVVRDEHGDRVLLVGRDITARREAEFDLDRERQRAARLTVIDEVRTTFLHAVAHDLRSPVTAILGSAATLLHRDVAIGPENERALLRAIESNARRLERMLTDLLDLDRLDQGRVDADRRPVEVGARLQEILAEWTEAGGREVALRANVGEATIDPVMLERIVLNLLSNAARYSPADGSITLRAEWAARERSALMVTVEDAGPGVPAELRTAVFERFRRAPGSEGEPGMGIGLWLVAAFAALHGGSAWVEDRVGGGAAFKVLLRDAAPSDE
jgi:PAS domain S-box-containing protein